MVITEQALEIDSLMLQYTVQLIIVLNKLQRNTEAIA